MTNSLDSMTNLEKMGDYPRRLGQGSLLYDLHSLSELGLWLIEFEGGRSRTLFLVGILPFCTDLGCMVLGF
jgi:hypothetical protein